MNDMIKGTYEQPDEEVHKVRSGRVPNAGASVQGAGGVPSIWYFDMFINLEALQIPHYWNFYGGFVT